MSLPLSPESAEPESAEPDSEELDSEPESLAVIVFVALTLVSAALVNVESARSSDGHAARPSARGIESSANILFMLSSWWPESSSSDSMTRLDLLRPIKLV